MWAIWANKLLPKALKSCPKSYKSPNLVTLGSQAMEEGQTQQQKSEKIFLQGLPLVPWLLLEQHPLPLEWLWLSWKSGRFRHQRYAARIQLLENLMFYQMYQNDENKEKEAGMVFCKNIYNTTEWTTASFDFHQMAVHKRTIMLAHCNLKQNMWLCSKQYSFFPFMHCPLVANRKTRWSINKYFSF